MAASVATSPIASAHPQQTPLLLRLHRHGRRLHQRTQGPEDDRAQVPSGEALTFGDDNFVSLEAAGVKEARNAAFVLVAGGLGERLGYKGIKVALPRETTTGKCFLQHYIESILSLQEASSKMEGECHTKIPFAIMTSDATNALTIKLLETNSYFGMEPSQVKILKQEKVACLADNDARLALDPNDKYKIQTKPHGHGDVHSLLYSSGSLKQWTQMDCSLISVKASHLVLFLLNLMIATSGTSGSGKLDGLRRLLSFSMACCNSKETQLRR
ncbi:hypothetical protein ZWY2020_002378 [Hordeum vulgare]|nr:hypothetical protein ZWY2020_002378 [Hordeum vulgare]